MHFISVVKITEIILIIGLESVLVTKKKIIILLIKNKKIQQKKVLEW